MNSNNLNNYKQAYDKTQKYSFDNNIILNWYAQRVIEKYPSNLKVLDLGLGHGIVANILSKYFSDYLVLDGSEDIIEKYKKENPDSKARIKQTFFEDFKPDEQYDLIVMGFILEHVDNPLEILNRYKKFLSSDGKIIIAVPNAEAMNRRIGYYANLLDDLHKLSNMDKLLGHKRYFDIQSIKKLITDAGLIEDSIEGIYLKPVTTDQMLSLNFSESILKAFCDLGVLYPELSVGIMVEASINYEN